MEPELAAGHPRRRLDPTVGKARAMVGNLLGVKTTGKNRVVENPPLVLVGCSGGPDSLALAAVCAFFARRGEVRVGAVVVDHQMQNGSAEVARATAAQLRSLGLDPVVVRTVDLDDDGVGPEAAARAARFAALEATARELGARNVLLGHTLDDQAESVLLGLARGSGTRSLAGMRERRGMHLRPFLGLRRDETLAICEALGLAPWHDPANQDPAYLRVRVRANVIPFLGRELGPGIAESLARSASILGHDADCLDQLAAVEYGKLAERNAGSEAGNPAENGAKTSAANSAPGEIALSEEALRGLPPALRMRVLALAAVELGGVQPSLERLGSAENLLARQGSAGPVQLAGKVSAYRISRSQGVPQEGRSYGKLVLRRSP
ncbi:tRNA lysidine(34) synthetase TilS [Arthrobacter sp. H35-D1]|uniref:tRNA lysidine(34) synthetase TilS n=1 Tax=Arthrobacter sp. H35-D1 TaxID=3046202 RepID=UPI0024BB4E65|nr:tRNA lysidine(34) synthetase TilS [Arthrobacter sp. H35-D1]MDJ0312196.1 tRNA lysidine(34) synthetase TilS [Arthrobacter sp. H35-D1]